MYEDLNHPALYALMGAAGLFAYYLLSKGLQALASRTNHFDILTPVLNSCYNCTGGHIIPPKEAPTGVAVKALDQTVVECREMLRDETRMGGKELMDIWGFYYEGTTADYTEIAEKCPRFVPKIVNKNGSIG